MSDTVDRAGLLVELGYGEPAASAAALEVLVAKGLTNPRKTGIAASKCGRVEKVLRGSLRRTCPACRSLGMVDPRRPVPVEAPGNCDVCQGSPNRRAMVHAAAACRGSGMSKVVVVGGAPGVHAELRSLWPEDIALRVVSGTERHTAQAARVNLDWAHLIVIWASTELDHKVSRHYLDARSPRVFTVGRRSIQALADGIAEHVGNRGG